MYVHPNFSESRWHVKTYMNRFAHNMTRALLIGTPWVVVALLFVLIGTLFTALPNTISQDLPWRPAGWLDYTFLGIWLTSLIVPIVYLIKSSRTNVVYNLLAIVGLTAIIPATLYFGLMPVTLTKAHVAFGVHLSTAFYYIALTCLALGLLGVYYLERRRIEKNTWWQFVLAIPFLVLLYTEITGFMAYRQFTGIYDFKITNFYNMLKLLHGHLSLITRTPYSLLSVGMIAVISLPVAWVYFKLRQRLNRYLTNK